MPLMAKTKAHMDFASMYLHIPKVCSRHIHWKCTGDDFSDKQHVLLGS